MQNTVVDALSAMLLKHKDMARLAEDISGGIAHFVDILLLLMTDSLPRREHRFTLILKPATGP